MKLGMPILFEYDTIEENLVLAKKLNLDFLELNLNFGYCRREMEEGKLFDLLEKYNILATLHFYDEADFGSYDEVVEGYIKLFEKYVSLGHKYIKLVNVHNNPGPVVTISGVKNYIYDKEYNEYIIKLIRNLNRIKRICDKYNIELVIENTNIPTYMRKTYHDLNENGFFFNYDIGHDDNNGYVLLDIIKDEPLKFKEFHFHDGNHKQDHLSLGEGKMDLKKFKDLALKFDPYILLEVKQKSDLEKSVSYFKKL